MASKKKNTPKREASTSETKSASPFFATAKEEDYRGQGERWSHDGEEDVGASLMGTLVAVKPIKFKDGKDGQALVFSPAVELTPDGEIIAHRSIETIYSAVLAQKITAPTDIGATFALELTGYEKSEHKGRADFKKFNVAPVSPDALRKQLKDLSPALAALVATNA